MRSISTRNDSGIKCCQGIRLVMPLTAMQRSSKNRWMGLDLLETEVLICIVGGGLEAVSDNG